MGTPIKDRGIQWKEAYTDKSAYLKEQFEAQVGPGSYFRWEGHDHVSGADYYAVVTPGYSKKHGYHFFAALRKMPADNGASGKKFKNQAEALSYAMETWRVPPPDTQPHQAYVDTDLVGKPIVTENVHDAAADVEMVKTAEEEITVIIASEDEMEKTAMSLPRTGAMGMIFQSRGSKSNAAKMRYAAAAASIMGPGATMGLSKEWGLVDLQNQGAKEVFEPALAQKTKSVYPLISTAQSPNQEQFHQGVNVDGYWKLNRLFKLNKRNNTLETKQPAYREGENEGHRLVRFRDIEVIPVNVKVAQKQNDAFRGLIEAMNNPGRPLTNRDGSPALDSAGQPIIGHQILTKAGRPQYDSSGRPKYYKDDKGLPLGRLRSKYIRGRSGEVAETGHVPPPQNTNDDHQYQFNIPLDMFQTFKKVIGKKGSIDRLNFKYRNATDLYGHFEKNNQVNSQADFDRILQTPVFEMFDLKGGASVIYDPRGMPIGIKISTDRRMDMEGFTEGGQKPDEVQYQFKAGVVDGLLRRPEINGDLMKLRWALAKNQIPLTHDMLADVRTCAPQLYRIRSVLDRLDANGIPVPDEDGNLIKERTDLTPEFTVPITQGKVRQWDPERGAQVVVPVPQGVDLNQRFRGCQAIVEHAKQYIPVMKPNEYGEMEEQLHEIDAGEIKLYDTETVGSVCPGNHYTIMAKAANLSPKRTDLQTIHELGQQRVGIYLGYKETYATVKYIKGAPKDRTRTIINVVMRDGRVLRHPENHLDDPENEAVRIIEAAFTDPNAAAQIDGYYYVHQRQHPPKPLSTAKPRDASGNKAAKRISVDRMMRNPDGSISAAVDSAGRPLPPLLIGTEDALEGSGARSPTYFKNMRTIIDFLKAKFAFSDQDIGWWTDVSVDDYRHIDELVRVAAEKIKLVKEGSMDPNDLSEWERMISYFDFKKDVVPPEFLRRLAQISTDNPEDFAVKRGKIYVIQHATNDPLYANVKWPTFMTAEDANAFKDELAAQRNIPLVVREVQDAELVERPPERASSPLTRNTNITEAIMEFLDYGESEVVSTDEALRAEEAQSAETGDEAIPDEETDEDEGEEEEGEEGEEEEAPQEAPAAAPAPAAAEQPAEFPVEDDFTPEPAAPAEAPAPALPTEPVATQPEAVPEEPPAAPAPVPAPAPAPQPRWRPKNPNVAPAAPDKEASAIQRLIKLANTLDAQGKVEEADAVDKLIAITLEKKR